MTRPFHPVSARSWRVRAGGLAAAILAAATVLTIPAGASNQDVTFTLTPIAFGTVTIGTSTTGQTIVTNTTSSDLHFISASPSATAKGAEYHATAGTCTGALAPSATCDVDVTFAPNAKGLRASTLSVRFGEENAKGKVTAAATYDAALIGRGVAPTFTLTGASAGDVSVGQFGSAEATITNTSIIPLTLRSWSLQNAGQVFHVTAITCPSPILPGGSCGIGVTFSPHHTGAASATLSVSMLLVGTKASLVSRQATLSGTGVVASGKTQPFSLSPVDFGTVTVGTTATGSVVLTNLTGHNETLVSDSITSDKYGAFAVTGNDCPTPIPSATSCDLSVSYSPAAAITHNATLSAKVTFVNTKLVTVSQSSQTSLTGTGVNPTFTLAPSSFPSTTVGSSSSGYVTITNTSLVALTYADATFQGADQSSWATSGTTCAGPIGSGASCTVGVEFSPRGQGTLSVTIEVNLQLTVREHVTTLTHRAGLAGDGTLPTFTVSAPTLASTPQGVAVSGTSVVTNTSDVSISYDGYGFSGANAGDFSIDSGTSTCSSTAIAPGGSCDLTVVFDPSVDAAGTETASLKVTVAVVGTSPLVTTAESETVTGQES